MSSRFYFFTDPAVLDAQIPGQAFGPASTSGGKDQFRVTDLHTSTSTVSAYAVCRGRACVQAVRNSSNQIVSLNLILRPLEQPPFDFPYVEYFIYRNIEVSSLVDTSGDLDLGKEGSSPNQNDLIAFIRGKVLKRSTPESGTEAGKYIGLDRAHSSTTGADGGLFGDARPIDHLFRYPSDAELPMVEQGWKLGEFGGAAFGFEVVVQMYGAQPKLGWARQGAAALIEADTVATNATDDEKYRNRLARETIGCFADPSAFWGMFFSTGLYFRSPGTNDDKKSLKGKPLCDKLFPVSGGPFLNRDRLYLNLRNDTGYSYNFYRNYEDSSEDSLQIGPDAGNLATKKYGVDGWPIHFEDAVSGNTLCFRLRVDNASPLLFLHQIGSNSPGGKRFTDKSALLDASDLGWTKPIIFTRQSDSAGSRPPWCFVAHYLRGLDGSNVATSPTGVFDTAPLQFGPIGDRVVAAYDELWPASVTTSSPSTKNYERIFVSDKVFRYDGGSKSDPVDSTGAARSLVYDRVGDTYYIFQKGAATATAGQDSVIILQRRQYEGRREFIGSWSALEPVNPLAANQGLFFKLLSGKGLSTPISKTLTVSSGPPVTVLTFDELQNDTAVKKELFDFTFLCVSKAAFDPGITAANGGSSGGEVHTTFLSLITPQLSPGQFSSYDLAWKRWDGQNTVFASTSPSMPVYSADGVFFSSSDFDGGSLSNLASAYTMTTEEGWLSRLWDNVIDKDHQGESASSRMRALVDGFAFAVLEVSTTSSNPEGELAALVESYAPQIWDRAVLLVQDTTSPDSLEWSDRILYCARAKMEVSLKNHVYVLANPATQTRLIKRFEELSRNYAHLDFATAATRKRILVTGFDPFDPTGSGSSTVVNTNPSGKLALYFAQDPDWKSEIPQSHNNDLFIRTCIFPNRYQDFDEGIVESIIGNCIDVARLGNTPINAVCTCSLDPFIKLLITGFKLKDGTILSNLNNFNDVHVRIDRFAGKCRGGSLDNELKSSVVLADATLPDGSDKKVFYETKFKITFSNTAKKLTEYDTLNIKLRYNERICYLDLIGLRHPPKPGTANEIFLDHASGITILLSTAMVPQDVATAIEGSGGNYFSNEIFYRVSNLVQSVQAASSSGIKNGHIHIPDLGAYESVASATLLGTVTLADLVTSVLAVLDGVSDP